MHKFKAAMLSCQDPRLNEAHFNFLTEKAIMNQTDTIFCANPLLILIDPEDKENRSDLNFIKKKTDIAVDHHQISEFHICNHIDCGYYRIRGYFHGSEGSLDNEMNILTAHTIRAEGMVRRMYPDFNGEVFGYIFFPQNGSWLCRQIF